MNPTREDLDHAARLLRRLAGMAQVAAELALLAGQMGSSAGSDAPAHDRPGARKGDQASRDDGTEEVRR